MDAGRSAGVQSQQSNAQLRRALDVMFPHSYIALYHQPPHSVCTLFSFKNSAGSRPLASSSGPLEGAAGTKSCPRLEASSEPSSRAHVIQLQDQLRASLVEHRARPVGLCPIRRAIYDQTFDELIRQVTVGCVEQGLLLFQVRNELRSTLNSHRRLYESAVAYGLSKALEAKVGQLLLDPRDPKVGQQRDSGVGCGRAAERGDHKAGTRAADGGEAPARRLQEYYERELAKRDEIIGQQRDFIKTLNRKC